MCIRYVLINKRKHLCARSRATALVRDQARPSPRSFSSLPPVFESIVTRSESVAVSEMEGRRRRAISGGARAVRGTSGGATASSGHGLMGAGAGAVELAIDVRVWWCRRRRSSGDLFSYRRVPRAGDRRLEVVWRVGGGRGRKGWRGKKPLSRGHAEEDEAIDGHARKTKPSCAQRKKASGEVARGGRRLAAGSCAPPPPLACDLSRNRGP
jgi:hypothetical protein